MLTFGQMFGISLMAKAIARGETDRLIAAMPKDICTRELPMPGAIHPSHPAYHVNVTVVNYQPPEPPAPARWVAPEVDPVREALRAQQWAMAEQLMADEKSLMGNCHWSGPLESEWESHISKRFDLYDQCRRAKEQLYREMAK